MMNKDEANQIIAYQREVYNTIASHFSNTRKFLWKDLQSFSSFVEEGGTVVDLGCGNGRLYQVFDKKQVNYIGVDQSDNLIALAKKRFPEARFLVKDMTATLLQEATADAVFSIAAFQHLPTKEIRLAGLKEMKRIAKPGSYIVMTNWNLHSTFAKKKYASQGPDEHNDFYIPWKNSFGKTLGVRYYHGFTMEELDELAKEAGLTMIEQRYIHKGEKSTREEGQNILTIMKS